MIALGTRVQALEVAYVARKDERNWYVPVKGNYGETEIEVNDKLSITRPKGFVHALERKGRWLHEVNDLTNKAVIAFPCVASGVVVGLETKHYGHSTPSSGGRNTYDGEYDFDQGYFAFHGKVDLYVVKSDLRSSGFYVPESALTVLP